MNQNIKPPKFLDETSNFKCSCPVEDWAKVSSYFQLSAEFADLAQLQLNRSSFLNQIRYSSGIFCLGHAFELLYKTLLTADGSKSRGHNFGTLYGELPHTRKIELENVITRSGWSSASEFHGFMKEEIDFVNRKYHEVTGVLDVFTHDARGEIDHKLWPGLIRLWKEIHNFVASQIWINPNLPIH